MWPAAAAHLFPGATLSPKTEWRNVRTKSAIDLFFGRCILSIYPPACAIRAQCLTNRGRYFSLLASYGDRRRDAAVIAKRCQLNYGYGLKMQVRLLRFPASHVLHILCCTPEDASTSVCPTGRSLIHRRTYGGHRANMITFCRSSKYVVPADLSF